MFLENKETYNNLEACYLLSIGRKMRKTRWAKTEYIMFDDNGELVDELGRYEDWDLAQGERWAMIKE